VEAGESLVQSLWREIKEETGLSELTLIRQLIKAPIYADWVNEWQERNIFHLEAPTTLPDGWTHVVANGMKDKGLCFTFYWIPVVEAECHLSWGQGQWINLI